MAEIEKLGRWMNQIELDRSKLLDIYSYNYLLFQGLEDMGGQDRTPDGISSHIQSLTRAIGMTTKELLISTDGLVTELMTEMSAMRDAKAKADRMTGMGCQDIIAKLERTSKAIYDHAVNQTMTGEVAKA